MSAESVGQWEMHGLVHSRGENSVAMSGLVCDTSHCLEQGSYFLWF